MTITLRTLFVGDELSSLSLASSCVLKKGLRSFLKASITAGTKNAKKLGCPGLLSLFLLLFRRWASAVFMQSRFFLSPYGSKYNCSTYFTASSCWNGLNWSPLEAARRALENLSLFGSTIVLQTKWIQNELTFSGTFSRLHAISLVRNFGFFAIKLFDSKKINDFKGVGETGSMYVLSYQVHWYIHI